MKIAIVRGSNMNPFEMQSYGPLASAYDMTGYAGYDNHFELNGVGFPIKRLHTFEERYRWLPSPARSLAYGLSLPGGLNGRMSGLEKELADKDLIHTAETSTGYSYQAARVRNERKKKLVITVWENIPFLSTHQFMGFDRLPLVAGPARKALTGNDHIVRYVKDSADVLLAVTERAKAALMIEGVPEEKIRVAPVGVDTERFKPAEADPGMRRRLGVSDGDFVVLFMGRLVREKGVYDLLHAAKLLQRDASHVKIVMAGDGPEKGLMAETIRSLGIGDTVKLAGSFPYGQVPELYHASDAFILPSIPAPFWQEQFGMVLVEAMASGLPVVSTCCGSIPEVVGDAGALVEPNDPLSIHDEITRLATDGAYCDRLSRSGRKRATEKFSVDVVSRAIGSIYRELSG